MRLLFYIDGKQEGRSQRKKKKAQGAKMYLQRKNILDILFYVKFYINVPACGYEDIKKQSSIF